jgi:hypothetical protein
LAAGARLRPWAGAHCVATRALEANICELTGCVRAPGSLGV